MEYTGRPAEDEHHPHRGTPPDDLCSTPRNCSLDQYHPWFNTISVIIIACAITGLCIVLFIIVSRLKKKFLPYQAPTIAADTEWIELPQANVVRQV